MTRLSGPARERLRRLVSERVRERCSAEEGQRGGTRNRGLCVRPAPKAGAVPLAPRASDARRRRPPGEGGNQFSAGYELDRAGYELDRLDVKSVTPVRLVAKDASEHLLRLVP